ncbi:hypothetical protein AAEJ74_14395 [Limnospira fusiformis PMC 851.14]|uniref:Uncharacterized protein n=2 Tax=Limnospira fusiformis TaxID=54297 RepID=A0ABU9ELQ0_LIMFS
MRSRLWLLLAKNPDYLWSLNILLFQAIGAGSQIMWLKSGLSKETAPTLRKSQFGYNSCKIDRKSCYSYG